MKKILSILLLVAMLATVLTACAPTPFSEKEETSSQGSIDNNSTNNDTSDTDSDTNSNTNTNNNNDNSNTPSTTLTEEEKYNNALSLLSKGKNQEAYELLNEIKTYAPAQEKLKNFFYAPTSVREGNIGYANDKKEMIYYNVSYTYDTAGNIKSMTDVNNQTFYFTYDSNGNILSGYDLDWPSTSDVYIYSYKNDKLNTVTYGKITEEYFYNDNGSINKIVVRNGYNNSTEEIAYTYTYFSNGNIKSMSWADNHDGVITEYQYNENGNISKALLYEFDDDYKELWGYFDVSYGDHGVSAATLYIAYFGNEPYANYSYIYDSNGKLIEFRLIEDGEITATYSFLEHTLCYSENPLTVERVSIINQTNIDSIISFFD